MNAVAIELDALGDTKPLWRAWLDAAARRFEAIAHLDVAALPEDRAEAVVELDRWAARGIGDWRAALERYAQDHAALHLRPDAELASTLRALAGARTRIGVFTDAPEPLARVALAQLGAARRVEALVCGESALERLLGQLGTAAAVARSREEVLRLAD